jgi:hypothetical protein
MAAENGQNHAQRFAAICDALDNCKLDDPTLDYEIYDKLVKQGVLGKGASVKEYLAFWVEHTLKRNKSVVVHTPVKYSFKGTTTGTPHRVVTCKGEYRRELPEDIVFAIMSIPGMSLPDKINPNWITAYLYDVLPSKEKLGWENFELSHRCIQAGLHVYEKNADGPFEVCTSYNCFVWESKSANQARANPACRKMCHCSCGVFVCAANRVCDPCCL